MFVMLDEASNHPYERTKFMGDSLSSLTMTTAVSPDRLQVFQ